IEGDDGLAGEAVAQQIAAPHFGLAEGIAGADAAGDEHHRGDAAEVQRGGVVEPGAQDRRRMPVVLGRSQHRNGVGGGGLVAGAGDGHRDHDGGPADAEQHEQECRGVEAPTDGPEGHGAKYTLAPTLPCGYGFVRISSNSATARGSLVWPSQNIACLRTSGLRCDLAMRINAGTPSSCGSSEMAKTALFLTSSSTLSSSTRSERSLVAAAPAAWPSQKTAERRVSSWTARSRARRSRSGQMVTLSASVAGKTASRPALVLARARPRR